MYADSEFQVAAMAADARFIHLHAGGAVPVRAATPEDEAGLAAFFDQVGDKDRRFRFLHAVGHLNHAALEPMVSCDHFHTEHFLAFNPDDRSILASAMIACDAPLDTAELAVSVRGDRRGEGIGWAMLELLAEEARRRGVRRVIAIEDRDNRPAITLEREQGFVPHAIDGEPTLVLLEKLLR